jgi:pimeloyl-ACP methyl ester carboxylesterase
MSVDTAMNADSAVRPFHVDVAEEAIVDLRRRIAAWRPPEQEPVDDQSQGVQLATVQDLANYWATEYDWRRVEAKLNALPQFTTEIDGLDVHFIHVRSQHEDALPLIVSHGWPGSVVEQLKIIEPLTNPTAHGGSASEAFDVVIPSLPGYGFSGKPAAPGWGPDRIARAWAVLMERLGYTRYVAQGGDWGTAISAAMARQAPQGLLGIHVNFAQMVPLQILGHIRNGDPPPTDLSDAERRAYGQVAFATYRRGYGIIQGTRPQTIGYSLADTPVGLAAWLLDHDTISYEHLAQLLPDIPSAPSRATTCSTTPRSTGSPTRRRPRRGCTGSRARLAATSTPPPTSPSRRRSRCFRRSTSRRRAAGPRRRTTT